MEEVVQREDNSGFVAWPSAWGEDPINGTRVRHGDDQRIRNIVAKLNKCKDASEWEQHWSKDASWEHGENVSQALVALDVCLYRASQGSQLHLDSLVQGFEKDLFPDHPIAPWKERWMRDKFVYFLIENNASSSRQRLAELVLDHWPWAFAWAGQGSQDFKHPLNKAIRSGNLAFAEKMMQKIPADHWLHWSNPYDMRSIWREAHWRQGDVSWFNKMASYDPRILHVDRKAGVGPLEMACKEGAFQVVDKLLSQGMLPDPTQSFGQTLAHWAVSGLSHSRWNPTRMDYEPKSSSDIERDAIACGKTLAVLANHGHGMDVPVVKMKAIPGIRRKPGLPKHPETAGQFLERKRDDQLSPATVALVQQAYMQTLATPPVPVVVVRPRL